VTGGPRPAPTLDARALLEALTRRGVTFLAGVPDSTLQPLFRAVEADPALRYVPAVREDVALGIASAAWFAGRRGGVLMQNSGLGNLVNPLTSFSLMYRIPVLLVVGWRGHGGPGGDAPEHWIMGEKTTALLDLLGVPHAVLEPGDADGAVGRVLEAMDAREVPGALLVRPGVLA
jgi:sulfopyruvate decarboxylase subunit alpha